MRIQANELKAVALFASKDPLDGALAGVHVDPVRGVVVACDRKSVAMCKVQSGPMEIGDPFTLTECGVALCVALCAAAGMNELSVMYVDEELTIEADTAAAIVKGPAGVWALKFPSWPKMIPTNVARESVTNAAAVDAAIVGKMAKVAKLLGCESAGVTVWNCGANSPLVLKLNESERFVAVVQQLSNCQVEFDLGLGGGK